MAHGIKASFSGSEMENDIQAHTIVFDVSLIAQKHAHVLSRMKTSDGRPSGHIYGVFKQVRSLIWRLKPKVVVFAYDRKCVWRNQLVASYKQGRRPADATEDSWTPAPEVERLLAGFPGLHLYADDSEADDMIAWYVNSTPLSLRDGSIAIVSTDRDMYQLVSNAEDVAIVVAKKPRGPKSRTVNHWIREDEVAEEFGVPPSAVARVKALLGDPSDKIDGLKGASRPGKKEALRKFATLPDADDYFDASKPLPSFVFMPDWLIPEMTAQRDQMIRNLKITDLKIITCVPADPTPKETNIASILDVLIEFECESLLSQVVPFFESIKAPNRL